MYTNGDGKSASALEREADETRAQLSATLDELRFRMTPGQVVDQLVDVARDSGGGDFVRNLGRQAMENPIPVLLMGAGVAWLLAGPRGRARPAQPEPDRRAVDRTAREARAAAANAYAANDYSSGASSGADASTSTLAGMRRAAGDAIGAARAAAQSATSRASQMMERGASAADDAAEAAAQRMRGMSDRASTYSNGANDTMRTTSSRASAAAAAAAGRLSSAADAAWESGHRIADAGYSAGGSIARVFREQPLLVGAMGVAIGAAIAAALPQTEIERDYVGPTSDSFKEEAQRAVQEHYEQLKAAASGAVTAARSELDRQFDSATDVVRTAGERLTDAADRAIGAMEQGVKEAKTQLAETKDDSGNTRASGATGKTGGGASGMSNAGWGGTGMSGASDRETSGSGKKTSSGPASTGTLPGRSERP